MIENIVIIILIGIMALFQWGIMIIGGEVNPRHWRVGLLVGMAGAGFTIFGLLKPVLNPYPWLTLTLSESFMLGMVLERYYRRAFTFEGLSPDQVVIVSGQRFRFIQRMIIGIVILAFIAIAAAFIEGLKASNATQEKTSKTLDKISNAQDELAEGQEILDRRTTILEQKQDIFQKKVLANQTQGLSNQKKTLEGLDVIAKKSGTRPKAVNKSSKKVNVSANKMSTIPTKVYSTSISETIPTSKVDKKPGTKPKKTFWESLWPF